MCIYTQHTYIACSNLPSSVWLTGCKPSLCLLCLAPLSCFALMADSGSQLFQKIRAFA